MSDEATIAIEETAIAPRHRLKVDLTSSYALSLARVGSMAAIVALLFRYTTAEYAATFILIRTMLGTLNYAFSGISPATQRELLQTSNDVPMACVAAVENVGGTLAYVSRVAIAPVALRPAAILSHANAASMFAAVCVGWFGLQWYARSFVGLHHVAISRTYVIPGFVMAYGFGLLARLGTEPSSAALQTRGRLAVDNLILVIGEVAWPTLCWMSVLADPMKNYSYVGLFGDVGSTFALVGFVVAVLRWVAGRWTIGSNVGGFYLFAPSLIARLARNSVVASLGSFADFLYAPFNLLLISNTIGPRVVADYSPALQFDAALLLLVGAIASTILPRAMRLAAEGERPALHSLYVGALASSFGLLACAAVTVWLVSPFLLHLWLGRPMPVTLAILPLVLIHTVVGGTAGIGRAVLLGMGRFKAYTVSALVGGVANVSLALLFVLGFGWGLRGVVFATIVAVVGRCAIWMPWYILRSLRPAIVAPEIAPKGDASAR